MIQGHNLRFRQLLPWVGLALLGTMAPFLYAWLVTPPDKFFTGVLANHNDFSGYLTAMRQGAEGYWLFRFTFSPEAWQPRLVLFFYIIAGKLLRSFSQNYTLWLNILRVWGLLLALWGFQFWLKEIFPGQRRQQVTAWFLITFGSGIGWLLWPLAVVLGISGRYFPDVATPEWSTTLIALNPPHYIWGMGLEVILFGCVMRMTQRPQHSWHWAIAATAAAIILGLIYVYHLAVTTVVIGLYLLLLAWQNKRIPWQHWLQGAMIIIPLLPLLFYYGYWVNRDEAWATYVFSDLNDIPPPPLLGLLFGFGLLAVLAIVGFARWQKQGRDWLLPAWIMGNLLVMYLPIVQYSGRFTMGLIIPVASMAAYGLEEIALPRLKMTRFYTLLSRFTPTPYDTLRRLVLILSVPSSLMIILFLIKNTAVQKDFPHYMPVGEQKAMEWLVDNVDEGDLVLAYYPVGNYLPILGNIRVFMGHFGFTLNFNEKVDQVEQFWNANTSDAWREAFIAQWQITYIYEGRYEQQIMHGETTPPGDIVYDQDGVVIYQVRP